MTTLTDSSAQSLAENRFGYISFERNPDNLDILNGVYSQNLDYVPEAASGTVQTLTNGGVHRIELGGEMKQLDPDRVLKIFAATAMVIYMHQDSGRVNLFNMRNASSIHDLSENGDSVIGCIRQQDDLGVQQLSVVYAFEDTKTETIQQKRAKNFVDKLTSLASPIHKIALIK
jgi:hypothetical protein